MFLLPDDYWEVRNTPKKGRGVFAKKNIEGGTVIGDYLGRILKDDDPEKENEGFYEMSYTDDTSIWPNINSNGIHLINNSCTPNCFMYSYKDHMLYFALRKIFAGEELTVSYCLSPIDNDCSPCHHTCHCGSEFCTGSMHLTKEHYDRWKAFDDSCRKDLVIPPFSFGDELPKLTSYPKTIEDDDVFPLFGAQNKETYTLLDTKLPPNHELRKLIRETGQRLAFTNINMTVCGMIDNHIFCKTTY